MGGGIEAPAQAVVAPMLNQDKIDESKVTKDLPSYVAHTTPVRDSKRTDLQHILIQLPGGHGNWGLFFKKERLKLIFNFIYPSLTLSKDRQRGDVDDLLSKVPMSGAKAGFEKVLDKQGKFVEKETQKLPTWKQSLAKVWAPCAIWACGIFAAFWFREKWFPTFKSYFLPAKLDENGQPIPDGSLLNAAGVLEKKSFKSSKYYVPVLAGSGLLAATGVGYAYKKGYFSKSESDASRSVPGTGKAQNGGAPRTGSEIQDAVNAIDQEEANSRQLKFKIFLCVLFAVIAYLLWKEMSREI